MAFLLIVVLCLFAAFAGARGALIVPIVLWPIDRLPWPVALAIAAISFYAWRAFAARRVLPAASPISVTASSLRRIPAARGLSRAHDMPDRLGREPR